jgi:hypothetical protein
VPHYVARGLAVRQPEGWGCVGGVLLLLWRGNILYFHSEAVARMSGRKPAFLLMPVGVQLIPAKAGESPREFGEHTRSR